MIAFALYIALGDSISIDVYPAEDAERRHRGRFSTDRLGAVSLLCRNDDRGWPEFQGKDLHTLSPATKCVDSTADGATTMSLLRQIERITPSNEPTLVTSTAGGNDLLGFLGSPGPDPVPEIFERLQTAVTRVLELRPN